MSTLSPFAAAALLALAVAVPAQGRSVHGGSTLISQALLTAVQTTTASLPSAS